MAPAIQIAAVGAFVAGHEAGKRMIPKGKGTTETRRFSWGGGGKHTQSVKKNSSNCGLTRGRGFPFHPNLPLTLADFSIASREIAESKKPKSPPNFFSRKKLILYAF